MNFDLGKLIEVLAEHAPNEAVGIFIATYGVFIIAFILIVIALIRFAKKTNNGKDATDKDIAATREAVKEIAKQATDISLKNSNVTNEIKAEIKANNDVVLQLMIAMGIKCGMNYTDISNIINSAKSMYSAAAEQYNALEQDAVAKVEEQIKAEAKIKAEAQAKEEQLQADLASIKIGV